MRIFTSHSRFVRQVVGYTAIAAIAGGIPECCRVLLGITEETESSSSQSLMIAEENSDPPAVDRSNRDTSSNEIPERIISEIIPDSGEAAGSQESGQAASPGSSLDEGTSPSDPGKVTLTTNTDPGNSIRPSAPPSVNRRIPRLILGVNPYIFGGDRPENSRPVLGTHVGAYWQMPLTDRFTLEPGIGYSSRGNRAVSEYGYENYTYRYETRTRLQYLDVQSLVSTNIGTGLGVFTGPRASFLLGAQTTSSHDGNKSKTRGTEYLRTIDAGWVLGARYQPRRFFIGFQASYYHGFTNISKAKSHYYVPGGNYGAAAKKIYNRGVHLGLTYNLPAYFSARKAVTTKHVSAEEARRQEEVRKQRAEAERNKPKKYGIRR